MEALMGCPRTWSLTLILPLVVLLTVPFVPGARTPATAQQPLEFHFAYRPAAFDALRENIDRVSIVSPEPFIVHADGSVTGELEPRLLELAREHGVRVMPQIKNLDTSRGLFSQEVARSILNDDVARRRVVESMVEICRRYDLYGMQVDLEAVHIDDRDALTRFYREAADALHADGRAISIAVVHRAEESPGPTSYTQWMMEDWRGAFDLAALGEIGDFVKMMSYGQHTRRTPPGPSQGLPWLEAVTEYFLRYVPAEKLSLGITMAGSRYHAMADPDRFHIHARSWSSGISREDGEELVATHEGSGLQWDDRQKVLFGYIENGGVFEWLFIDNDLRSLDAKLDLVRRHDLRAINMWVSGREDPGLWDRVRDFRYDD
jgi:spore germination protein